MICGVDEAGRGAVIGPLIVCLAACSDRHKIKLLGLRAKDSKLLSQEERERIFDEAKKFISFRFVVFSASEINRLMAEQSLNDIEADAVAKLVKQVKGSADIMVDLPDRYFWVFADRMKKRGVKKVEAEHFADRNYPIVSVASIGAKVVREKKVSELKEMFGDFGSGYPSDKKTRGFLMHRKNIELMGDHIRKEWKTLERIKQRKLFE